jgi:hypothetical protein
MEDALSSKSLKRFLENFQMKKAMMAITAMPPATDMPMIGPTPRPLVESVECVAVGAGVVEDASVLVWVTVTAPVSVLADVGVVVDEGVVLGCVVEVLEVVEEVVVEVVVVELLVVVVVDGVVVVEGVVVGGVLVGVVAELTEGEIWSTGVVVAWRGWFVAITLWERARAIKHESKVETFMGIERGRVKGLVVAHVVQRVAFDAWRVVAVLPSLPNNQCHCAYSQPRIYFLLRPIAG